MIAANIRTGKERRSRLTPLAFIAMILLNLFRLLKVINVAKSTAAGEIRDTITGMEKRKYVAICMTDAELLRNILIFSKKSMMRYSEIKETQVITKNLVNSLNIYLSSSRKVHLRPSTFCATGKLLSCASTISHYK